MDFDFNRISSPFRMQPGLARLDAGANHLTRLDPGCALYREKRSVSRSGAAHQCVEGFDPSNAVRTIWSNARSTLQFPEDAPPDIELAFEEDFALLDATTGTIPWMCVCVPSHWAPEDKLGKSIAAIHAPVAGNADLQRALSRLTSMVCQGGHWERFVWTISPSPHYDQHPRRQARGAWPSTNSPDQFVAGCHFRAERQTFMPVHDAAGTPLEQAVFTIRVMLEPLVHVVRTREQALRLHEALHSMSAEVLAYKHLALARGPLLAWLSSWVDRADR